MNNPLPPDLQRRWGHLPDIRQRGPNEWSGACPQCGGGGNRRDPSDRFRMFAGDATKGARGWCRQCHYFAWANDDQQRPDLEQVRVATAERLHLAEQENIRIKDKLQRIASADFWKRWHDDMSEQQRVWWERQGIIRYFQDYYKLGYCPDHPFFYAGQEYHSPSMTIPHFGPAWILSNIQHRLLNPPEANDKYRQMAGVPAAMFLTEPDTPLTGAVLIVEGAKKAIVTYTHLDTKEQINIVSIPSKTPSSEMLERFNGCEPVYLALDPDAYEPTRTKDGKTIPPAAVRIAAVIGKQVRFVQFPAKVDDMLVKYGVEGKSLSKYIKRATVTV